MGYPELLRMTDPASRKGFLFIISGPAGSGKTTICDGLIELEGLQRIITTTTRSPRLGEIEGRDYYFCSRSEFEKKISEEAFYEYATVHNHYYGTQRSAILEPILAGEHRMLNIDVQGAQTIRDKARQDPALVGQVVSIFVMPPSLDVLKERLQGRGTDSAAEIERRLKVAEAEIKQHSSYDHCIHSDTKAKDLANMRSLYKATLAGNNLNCDH